MSNKKPEGCKDCPLCEVGKGFVRPEWDAPIDQPKLLIQGEAPGRNEVEQGKPFVGEAGHWLRRNILANAGVSDAEVIFDNTIRCLVGGVSGGYPTGKPRTAAEQACRQYDVWSMFPNTPLLLVGSKACGQWMADDRISKWHGSVEARDGRLISATYHPSAVMRNPNLLPLVIQETRNLIRAQLNPNLLNKPTVHKGFIYEQNLPFTFDLEWSDNGTITIMGVSYSHGEAYSTYCDGSELDWLRDRLENGAVSISGHNIYTADLLMLGFSFEQLYAMADSGCVSDTMIKSHMVHPHFAELGLYGLSDMCKYYDPMGEWKYETVRAADPRDYNGEDAARNRRLDNHLDRDLAYTQQTHLVKKQHKLACLTVEMKLRGIKLDTTALDQYARQRQAQRESYKGQLEFNPDSWQQVKKWAASIGIKLKDTKYETLKKHEGKHPAFDDLLDYREDSKSLTTWFPLEMVGEDLRCVDNFFYPTFHTTGTAVKRPSCSDPNILNLPEGGTRQMSGGHTREMPNLRQFLIPRDPELEFVSYDFSSIEHRTLAFVFEDWKKLTDLNSGIKTYTRVAAEHYGRRYEDVPKDEYRMAKTVVLATDYCETAFNLATRLFGGRSREQVRAAERLQQSYFHTYPATKAGQDRVGRQLDAGDLGLRNPFGSLRKIYAQNSHERKKRGVHFLGCSTAAELVNQRMIDIYEALKLVPFQWCYDELAYELPIGEMTIRKQIKEILEQPCPELGGMVIPVECKVGRSYGTLRSVEL